METYLGLLDQNVEGSDTAPVTARHAVYFIHDEAAAFANVNACGRRILQESSKRMSVGRQNGTSQTSLGHTIMLPPENQLSKEELSTLVAFYSVVRSAVVSI